MAALTAIVSRLRLLLLNATAAHCRVFGERAAAFAERAAQECASVRGEEMAQLIAAEQQMIRYFAGGECARAALFRPVSLSTSFRLLTNKLAPWILCWVARARIATSQVTTSHRSDPHHRSHKAS